ncbi:MAG TPA: type II toxin-antitoxin system HicB family antitoxin [Pyrinomonadaceae bacterium]|nr:type II toxin-antitoxin system HicB family antitoxin [Pyrinomonadaceae bacterium]
MHYKVALQQSEEGFSVSCPALPGCWSQGETEEEALDNIKAAIAEYLDVLEDQFENAIVREVEVAA